MWVVVIALVCTSVLAQDSAESTPGEGRKALMFSSRAHNARCTDCVKLGETKRRMVTEELQKSDDFTIEAWVKVTPWPTKTHGVEGMGWAFMHAGPCSYNQCAFLGFRHDGAVLFGLILDDLVSPPSFRDDEDVWVHWATTYRVETKERVLYRNGVEVARGITKPAGYEPHSNDLTIGSDNWSNHPFPGIVDEIRVWRNVALTPTVLQEFMCARSLDAHPHAAALVVRYTFDDAGAPRVDPDALPVYDARPLVAEEGGPLPGGGEPGFDLEKCSAACNAHPKCRSFSFNAVLGACYLKDKCVEPGAKPNHRPDAKNYQTYSRECLVARASSVGLGDYRAGAEGQGRVLTIADGVKVVEGRRDEDCPVPIAPLIAGITTTKDEEQAEEQNEPVVPNEEVVPQSILEQPEPVVVLSEPEPVVVDDRADDRIRPSTSPVVVVEEVRVPPEVAAPPDMSRLALVLLGSVVLLLAAVALHRLQRSANRKRTTLRETPLLPTRSFGHDD